MITMPTNPRRLIGQGTLIASGLLTGALGAALIILLAAATGI